MTKRLASSVRPFYGLKIPLAALTLSTLLAVPEARAAVVAFSDFSGGDDGWTGVSCTNPGLCLPASPAVAVQHRATGGNPDAYVRTIDPGENDAARLVAPVAFTSALAVGQTLSFDVRVETNGGGGIYDPNADFAPLVTIETSGFGTLVYTLPNTLFPDIDGDWAHYDVVFDGSDPAWRLFTGVLSAVTPAQFETVFAARTRLSLIGEWLKEGGEVDSGGIDNVTLTAVPLPAALPAFSLALLAFSCAVQRPR